MGVEHQLTFLSQMWSFFFFFFFTKPAEIRGTVFPGESHLRQCRANHNFEPTALVELLQNFTGIKFFLLPQGLLRAHVCSAWGLVSCLTGKKQASNPHPLDPSVQSLTLGSMVVQNGVDSCTWRGTTAGRRTIWLGLGWVRVVVVANARRRDGGN